MLIPVSSAGLLIDSDKIQLYGKTGNRKKREDRRQKTEDRRQRAEDRGQ
jgi:hypothetical protein